MSGKTNFGTLLRASFLALVLSLAVSIDLPIATTPVAGATEVDDEAGFVSRINQLRAGLGLNTLSIDTELVTESRSWAAQLLTNGSLSHASDLSVGVTSNWAKLGENVGVADTNQFDELFEAFVNSPLHYANLVDPDFTHVGTGVVYGVNGRMWTTHRFMAKLEATTTTQATATTQVATTQVATTGQSTTTDTTAVTETSGETTSTTRAQETSTSSETTTTTKTTTTTAPVPTSSTVTSKDGLTHVRLEPIPTKPIDRRLLTGIFVDLAG